MNAKTKIGLFFGSFNPIHNGHLAIADYFCEQTDLAEVWLVVSPQNPLKINKLLLPDQARLEMTRNAIQHKNHLHLCDVEFQLPKPSFTIDTLSFLTKQFPHYQFVIIIGGDNLAIFNQWKDYRTILDSWNIYVYNRPDYQDVVFKDEPNVFFFEAPLYPLSSTMIRQKMAQNEDVGTLVPAAVVDYFHHHPELLKNFIAFC